MARSGVCCASLEEPKALMKMGLSIILIGHVNFLLAALVHGVVLRHINLHKQARAMEYAISNVVAFTSGLVGVIVGILAIILSKNKRRRDLMWGLFTVSLASALMAAASAIGLTISVVRAIIYNGRSLLTHCRFPDAIGYSSVTNECPFDPTRIYSTTLILWVPLIVTCTVQLVFSSRCFTTCLSFLGLSCCHTRTRRSTVINMNRPVVAATLPSQTRLLRSHREPPVRRTEHHRGHDDPAAHRSGLQKSHNEPLRIYTEPPRRVAAPPRHQKRPPPPPLLLSHHQSLPSSNRKPVRQPASERSSREKRETTSGSRHRPPEQYQLLQRGAVERSSVWI